jgi:hypothetical protein
MMRARPSDPPLAAPVPCPPPPSALSNPRHSSCKLSRPTAPLPTPHSQPAPVRPPLAPRVLATRHPAEELSRLTI